MLQKIRHSRFTKVVSLLLAFQFFMSGFDLNLAFAGDGGPTQPEVQSFEPMGTNQMVDLFTGDLTYNIPLFNLPGPDGGYPINLAYHSGIQPEQEASWVGLGWNINMGTVNRQVRNLPDDFGGDNTEENVVIKTDMRSNWTVGVGVANGGINLEIVGVPAHLGGSATVYYNNYRGIGYTLDASLSLRLENTDKYKLHGDLGFNLKLDSQEGISQNVSAGAGILDTEDPLKSDSKGSLTASTGFNSRTGWQQNINVGLKVRDSQDEKSRFRTNSGSTSSGSVISFARTLVPMQVNNAMRGINGSFDFTRGENVVGFFRVKRSSGYFTTSWLRNRAEEIGYKGAGYLYYQKSGDDLLDEEKDYRIKDVARENDGLVHKNTRRMGTPTLTYDIYSVTGQGIGNMFRPVRAEIGAVTPVKVKSEYNGGSFGFEKTAKSWMRLGVDIGYKFSSSKITNWPNANAANYPFIDTDASLMRSVYFKNYGETSHDDLLANYGASIASNEPVVYGLNAEDNFYDITDTDAITGDPIEIQTTRTTRRKRAVGVEPFTNSMIVYNQSGIATTIIPEFNISYYGSSSDNYNRASRTSYTTERSSQQATRVGGYVTTSEAGMRYVYALPAINKKEKDVTYSVKESSGMASTSRIEFSGPLEYKHKGTDKYYNSIEKKEYAHSYLLTSILGTDYVDNDAVPGPSDGDLGYWVRFDYVKAHSNYKWRAPYKGVQYDKGYRTAFTDGKGRYTYGEKEIWYVATAETKTHVAEFIVSSTRDDAKQVSGEINGGQGSGGYYKLDKINIYVKSERYPNGGTINLSAKPLQTCHFTYNYNLCKGTPDNGPSAGKLTLQKLHFTYRNNTNGVTRPYEFEYNTQVGGQEILYAHSNVDRWGNYQPGTNASNIDYPYVNPYTSKTVMDQRAALWNLKAINLPSGGRYEIDYESDSYAYVQDEVAMQMFPIASLDPHGANGAMEHKINHGKNGTYSDRRVYFKLEQPLESGLTTAEKNKEMQKYIRPGEYAYFKVMINLTKNSDSKEYVAGYARVNDIKVDESSIVEEKYEWGYVELDNIKVDGQSTDFHPFTEAGARHIRYNQPQILYDNAPNADMDDLSVSYAKNTAWSLITIGHDILNAFQEYTNMLYSEKGRVSEIDCQLSYLRLRTPDKIKYGGGHRVKQVKIIDNWAASFLTNGEASSTYGTVYEYGMQENGMTISSGVAAYEPMVGGDEIPLRNPIKGWEDKNIATKNIAQTYTEEPGNESLFPGATVGYRQVKVMSLNTAQKKNIPSPGIVHYGGVTVHEFYTAKDYPVITDVSEMETDKTLRKSRLQIPALIINIDRLRMAGTQGYYIELNDMHGKPRSSRELAFNAQGQQQEISSVSYEYFDEAALTTNNAGETFTTRKLKNQVDILFHDIDPNDPAESDIRPGTLSTEIEFIPETRYSQSKSIAAGLNLNFDFVATAPLIYPIPYFNWSEQKVGTVVTNKIVNKGGIVRKIVAKQLGSVAETENLAFDDITGAPLLSSVTNDYGDKIYNYSILARDQYQGTGAAYENIGFSFLAQSSGSMSDGTQEVAAILSSDNTKLVEGDVLLAVPVTSGSTPVEDPSRSRQICRFQLRRLANQHPLLEVRTALSGNYKFTVIRSGKRNQLTSSISSITALSNPTTGRHTFNCIKAPNPNGYTYTTYDQLTIDNVLNITAMELGNEWFKDSRQIQAAPSTWYDNAFFSRGFGGNYSPVRSYTYNDQRTSGGNNVNLRYDGVMNGVSLFNWNNILGRGEQGECGSKWLETSTITLKNPSSFDIESRNILNISSSSLYGRNGTEPIAVASNAKHVEIGFESFEEYATGSLDISQNVTNNMNFYTSILSPATPRYVEDRFEITKGHGNTGVIAKPLSLFSFYDQFTVHGYFDGAILPSQTTHGPSKEALVKLTSPGTQLVVNGSSSSNTNVLLSTAIDITDLNSRNWRGEMFARRLLPNYPSAQNSGVSISSAMKHTGKQSLAISGSAVAKFAQARMNLEEGKEYQFSGWFSPANVSTMLRTYSQYFENDFTLEFFSLNGTLISSQNFAEKDVLQGNFIDDWQKFTVNFTVPAGASYVSITMPTIKPYQSSTRLVYFDDMRIQPREAAMESFVYNKENMRLEAQLDANNYATFYYYDDEGNLFLVKRETEKGIITVQESRSFMPKKP